MLEINALSPEMVGCYHVIVNKNKATYFTKLTLTHRIIGFNFGFFLKHLLTPWFLQFNRILIILLANSVSLVLKPETGIKAKN